MAKNKGGRPEKEIDLNLLERLASIQCTDKEIGALLGISHDTILRRKKENEDFAYHYEKGKENGKTSLRRLQWESAKKGNVTMQIWLGKQMLGQKDKSAQEVSGPDGGPIETANRNLEIKPDMDPKEAASRYAQMIRGK